jgi:hypothetical protein
MIVLAAGAMVWAATTVRTITGPVIGHGRTHQWPHRVRRDGDVRASMVDGSGRAQLTAGPAYDFNPSWSPNGSKIAFWSVDEGERPHVIPPSLQDAARSEETRESRIVSVPTLWIPPPRTPAVLAATMDSGIVSSPRLTMPPPAVIRTALAYRDIDEGQRAGIANATGKGAGRATLSDADVPQHDRGVSRDLHAPGLVPRSDGRRDAHAPDDDVLLAAALLGEQAPGP